MIKIVNTINEANIVTHSGKFHADDIFSTILLKKILGDVYVYRVYEIDDVNNNKIYYDIGGGIYDHHHLKNNIMRDEKIPYASFGLLWKDYGRKYLQNFNNIDIEYVFNYIDKKLVTGIDAVDNGIFYKNDAYEILDISGIISLFNLNYDENETIENRFIEACNFAEIVFDNIIKKAISICKSKTIIEEKINTSNNHILILEEYMPYKDHILNSKNEKAKEIYFVIHKSNRKGYMINTISKSLNDETLRMSFPKEWSGLRGDNLTKTCGINDVIFCHKNLFVASTLTLESAIKLVNKTLEINKN